MSNSKLYTILSWVLAPPIGSFIMLFVIGKNDPDAKFNAANATAVHGVMLAGSIVLSILAAIVFPLFFLRLLWDLAWFVIWVIGVILAIQSNGQRFKFPVFTDALAGLITSLEGMA